MRVPKLTLSVAVIVAGLVAAAPAAAQSSVLAPGDPPLTRQMVDQFTGFFEWVLDAPMSSAQRQDIQDSLVGSWVAGSQDDIDTVQQVVALNSQVTSAPADSRAVLRAQLQPKLLDSMRQQPSDQLSQLLLGVYASAHQALAAGNPPLTREMSDAFADFFIFAGNQIWGTDYHASSDIKDLFAQALVDSYPSYSADQQSFLGKMPPYWAALQVAWPNLSSAQRESYKALWRPLVGDAPSSPATGVPSESTSVSDDNSADTSDQTAAPDSGSSTADNWFAREKEHLFVNHFAPFPMGTAF